MTNLQEPKSPFKVDFNIYGYKDILPDIQEYLQHDFIINQEHRDKGRIEKMIWKKYEPEEGETDSPTFREQEVRRILFTGAYIWIKDYIIWLPPNYYYALQYGCTGEDPLQFRIKRLKHVYFKIRARANPNCIGTFTMKNRQDGETTISMHDNLWECADGNMNVGQIGIQSKTREDAQNPCWMAVQTLWNQLEPWLKEELYSDFRSGDQIAEKMVFMRKADKVKGKKARNVLMRYYPAVYNAMDGKNNMKKCILDEVLKWVECNFGDSLENYTRFIMPGFERRGLFDIFSTPPSQDCKSYREGYQVWQDSDPTQFTENGTTKSRLHRYRSEPLEGIQGAYDEYGDADANQIYDHIMRERKNCQKEKLPALIRDFALNEEESWGTLDSNTNIWSNWEGIKERKTFVSLMRFKDSAKQEPARIYGNLEWREGLIDTDVDFRMADVTEFDKDIARFCFSYVPQNKEDLIYNTEGKPIPPSYIENCLGVDPYNHRYTTKDRPSDHGMVNRKFMDLFQTGIKKVPTMIYCCRPTHQDIAFEDTIKAAVFNRSLIQYENRSDKLENYCEDRGYWDWLLPATSDSKRKGDAPTGKGAFLDEGIALIDAATNKPLTSDGIYYLLYYWFPELLGDYLKFDRKNTQSSNLTMADIQALIGCAKMLFRKVRQPSDVNTQVLNYLLG